LLGEGLSGSGWNDNVAQSASTDGSIIVGNADGLFISPGGNFNIQGLKWTNGSLSTLQRLLSGDNQTRVFSENSDGSVVVGYSGTGIDINNAFAATAQAVPMEGGGVAGSVSCPGTLSAWRMGSTTTAPLSWDYHVRPKIAQSAATKRQMGERSPARPRNTSPMGKMQQPRPL